MLFWHTGEVIEWDSEGIPPTHAFFPLGKKIEME